MRSRCGRRAFRASPIRCVGERIMATGVPEFREVAWRACGDYALSRHDAGFRITRPGMQDVIISKPADFEDPIQSLKIMETELSEVVILSP
ncbi:hypothetical protein [Bathymodiolus japonicus methanotrophic gill symbiont]|uniref:hypothetical protein n=1 Tax=Bathymodiolus japonicus methanotrophic gill symbiont TaxID=113269 RepID=UPI001C8DF386|nr:hypothetical protein [Bathymodiolus japonicus methanotrophic gill symbiont]